MSATPSIALEANGLSKRFGALHVTQDVSLSLLVGARTALIGPNGAGKTTLVNLLTGVIQPDQGRLRLFGEEVTSASAAARTRKGLVRTFQISSLFAQLSVFENIFIAVAQAAGRGFCIWHAAGRQKDLLERTEQLVVQLKLEADRHNKVNEIAYGRQRLVEIALALALMPRVLLLDEPAAGIPSNELDLLHGAIESLPRDIAVLMIEHDMEMVRRFATDVSVLVNGALLMSGRPAEVMSHPEVQSVYLGAAGKKRFDGALAHA
ncbi:amino acid/amide ABC transporter ATP-binding protein 1 (HAAT family) [Acidovorax sp. 100]|uniref:ABC transporter ATP-binding protein n=1 Tax=Acidovorax sp. 100 TaxID=2135635 RepID=UPI000EFA1E49|nr:ABC transporter ATP-binding protein [Acidovorax sp. 100]RMA59945.1 amino acid/amide ABC transporter ATP-binding protein 1 (HAAT family) [Acidovorax sp. 100]